MTGFGTAFAIHFTSGATLTDYRDTLTDDGERLRRFLFRALQEGLYLVPDGRFYTSAVHTEQELNQTLEGMERVFADPAV
jgi:glutamate-1-semialdehyde aminotransferase